jgi:hypothetical protein
MLIRTVAAAAALSLATVASADTVRLQYTGHGAGHSIRLNIGSTQINSVFAGQLIHSFSLGTGVMSGVTGNHITFCTDLTEYVSTSGATYTVAPIASLPQSAGWPAMGSVREQAVFDLYSAANSMEFGSSNDWATAFQVALWEVVYDYSGSASSLDLLHGNFEARNTSGGSLTSSIQTKIAALFGGLGMGHANPGLYGLTNNGSQDQLVQLVPLPLGSLWGAAGLGLVGVTKWRRGRRG